MVNGGLTAGDDHEPEPEPEPIKVVVSNHAKVPATIKTTMPATMPEVIGGLGDGGAVTGRLTCGHTLARPTQAPTRWGRACWEKFGLPGMDARPATVRALLRLGLAGGQG